MAAQHALDAVRLDRVEDAMPCRCAPSHECRQKNQPQAKGSREPMAAVKTGKCKRKSAGPLPTRTSHTAAITRGALYDHFADKRDFSRQVLLRESEAVTADIVAATYGDLLPRDALIAGGEAYLKAMAAPGRTRLLLIDGPAVLGMAEIIAMDEANAADTFRKGLPAAIPSADTGSINALSSLLSAAFDRAALELDAGTDPDEVPAAMRWPLNKMLG